MPRAFAALVAISVLSVTNASADVPPAPSYWTDSGIRDEGWPNTWNILGSDKFTITTAAEFGMFAHLLNSGAWSYFGCQAELAADIDLSAHLWVPVIIDYTFSANAAPVCFNGNGHQIRGLRIDDSCCAGYPGVAGLFGEFDGGTISDLHLVDVSIQLTGHHYYEYVGGLAGSANDATIERVTVSGDISAPGGKGYWLKVSYNPNAVGGIVGTGSLIIIDDCLNTATVSGAELVGGIIGCVFSDGQLSNLSNHGHISGDDYCIGGIVGGIYAGTVMNSLNTGVVTGETGGTGGISVGGIAGEFTIRSTPDTLDSYMANCWNGGDVMASDGSYVGGLVGWNRAPIFNSYNTGSVTGNYCVGGVVGALVADNALTIIADIRNVYSCGDVVGISNVGSLMGKSDLPAQDFFFYSHWGTDHLAGADPFGDAPGYPSFDVQNNLSAFAHEDLGDHSLLGDLNAWVNTNPSALTFTLKFWSERLDHGHMLPYLDGIGATIEPPATGFAVPVIIKIEVVDNTTLTIAVSNCVATGLSYRLWATADLTQSFAPFTAAGYPGTPVPWNSLEISDGIWVIENIPMLGDRHFFKAAAE